jgi:hypothetical protein
MGVYLTHSEPPFQLALLSPFPVSGAGDLMLGRQARGRYTVTRVRLFNSRDVGSGRFSEVDMCRALKCGGDVKYYCDGYQARVGVLSKKVLCVICHS